MEDSGDVCVAQINQGVLDDQHIISELAAQDISPVKNSHYTGNNDSSDDDSASIHKIKKRVQQFLDSDTEKENHLSHGNDELQSKSGSESEESRVQTSGRLKKSRILLEVSSSDSESSIIPETKKNEQQQMRMKNKRSKMKDKFKGLLGSRSKHVPSQNLSDNQSSGQEKSENSNSDEEMSSISKIKQKMKKSMASIPSICDPDTSDEEGDMNKSLPPKKRQKKAQKSTKLIEAKPIRMSAKQAMENMHLIKSESNRMLREKSVSLPYHRPKALSLKDIMARRKPAVTSDGKALPIKMNEEQLKQYVLQLEQRQKEMMELCKSESDDETAEQEFKELLLPDDHTIPETEITKESTNIEDSNDAEEAEFNIVSTTVNNDINTDQNDTDQITCTEVDVPYIESHNDQKDTRNESIDNETNQNDSNTDVKLVYNNDSIEEENVALDTENNITEKETTNKDFQTNEPKEDGSQDDKSKACLEQESQLISLHYTENNTEEISKETDFEKEIVCVDTEKIVLMETAIQDDFFSDEDIEMEDIEKIIENAELMKNSPMLSNETLNAKPKIMGAPGMLIDLDGTEPIPKHSGIELLKERFIYFSKLKTPEELEREKEKKLKPGAQHLKLKQELEEKIAEQRSLEWAKRLEEEKQLHQEMESILDDNEEADDSIDKIEAKLDEREESGSESVDEEELIEDDIEIKDKPRKNNPMVADEAEESDIDEDGEKETEPTKDDDNEGDENDEDSSYDESSESENEYQSSKPRKGRILKAFEDSDDEDSNKKDEIETVVDNTKEIENKGATLTKNVETITSSCEVQGLSQDDVIQLAQRHKSASDDLFTSQESSTRNENNKHKNSDEVLGTQTFSISSADPTNFICPSQPYHDPTLNAITSGFDHHMLSSQLPTQLSQSQPIGEDILALCTGKFYDNEFVSQIDGMQPTESISQDIINIHSEEKDLSNENHATNNSHLADIELTAENHGCISSINVNDNGDILSKEDNKKNNEDGHLLKSILDELDDPEFDKPKPNKFFDSADHSKNNLGDNSQMKKRLVIDSDDETYEGTAANDRMNKKLKKKKAEQRALQISDDESENEQEYGIDDDDYESDIEEEGDKLVEYDSEENEIEVKPDKQDKPKKKRKATDFFEQEAELTSEDEWVGSGDEDEHGLDRMEREEGDDDVFHQGKLRNELGQIHMRDVLDQDKREVRLLQELLFEDGDLGGGHRQRKFRWRDTGDEEAGTVPDELADTQEEEFESEEQWRKQRHEREVFLREMQKQDDEETSLNVTVNRTSIIKANLSSKSMSTLLMEANQSKTENINVTAVPEKKTIKNIPSPKKFFSILQQNYHSSLLTRGRGALARLAALATPLATDDDGPKIGSMVASKRNFVFAALTQEEEKPKVTMKRKADLGTPKLVKKMKIEEKQSHRKSSLLDHLNLCK